MENTQPEKETTQNIEEIFEDNKSSDFECDILDVNEDIDDSEKDLTNYENIPAVELKFEELCESINEEEKRLQELEERRKKLEVDMERLQEEIEREKLLFRQAIDLEMAKRSTPDISSEKNITEKIFYQSKIDPLRVNQEELASKLQEYREAMEESQMQKANSYEDDEELKRFKSNLLTYKKVLEDSTKEKIAKQKRKAAAKIIQKHLDEVDHKCTEQIDKIATIQKSIENIVVHGDTNNNRPDN